MTKESLEEIRKMVDAATPGPWSVANVTRRHGLDNKRHHTPIRVSVASFDGPTPIKCIARDIRYVQPGKVRGSGCDAEFIAKSREYVPALLDEVQWITAEYEWAQGVAEEALALVDNTKDSYEVQMSRMHSALVAIATARR